MTRPSSATVNSQSYNRQNNTRKVAVSNHWLTPQELRQYQRQLHGIGANAMFGHHIIGSVIQDDIVVGIWLMGGTSTPARKVMVGLHYPGSSFKDGSNSPISIVKYSVSQTVGLGHDQEVPTLPGSEPFDH